MSYILPIGSGGRHGGSRAALLVGFSADSHWQDMLFGRHSHFRKVLAAKRQCVAHDFFGTLIFTGA